MKGLNLLSHWGSKFLGVKVYVPLTTVRSGTETCQGCKSREVVHLQRSLRPLPGSGFHGNAICSILRLVLALLPPPPIKKLKLLIPHLPGRVLSSSALLSEWSHCFLVFLLFFGRRAVGQKEVPGFGHSTLYLSAAQTACSLSLRALDSL